MSQFIEITPLRRSETEILGRVFFAAIHEGAAAHYSAEQLRAWAPAEPKDAEWASRLLSQQTLVARHNNLPLGFITLGEGGYVDLFFVAPGHQRRGVGERLLRAAEEAARDTGLTQLHTQASLLLKGLLEKHGWTITHEQQVVRSDVKLTNFVMQKRLLKN